MNRTENKIVVYVVEDSQIICDIIRRLVLINDKIIVKTFLNGESVIRELNKCLPHIIFLDYYLDSVEKNKMNGDQVLKYAKTNIPDVPVVLLTSLSEPRKVNELLTIGFDGFIHKGEENLMDNIMDCIHKFCYV